ncbi:MAG: EAL domain-containing protein [Betaproteobacteria bacterium]|nr:EAL domain-containing protein [Betaproteobacteria bacterium]
MNAIPLARILVVDDEAANMRALCATLRDHGYETAGFTTGEDALRALQEKPFDLLLSDLMMPGMDGVALLAAALKIDPQLVGILMTGKGTIETAVQAMQAGALDYILKPFKVSALLPVVARAVSVRRLRLENLELRNTVAIHELNQAIAHTLDPNILLDKIADAALAQFDADEASIMLLADDGGSLYIAAVRGERRDTLLGTRLPLGEGIAGWVAARREPLVLEGEVKDPRLASLRPRADIQSALSMPMITRNQLIGVLNVNCIKKRHAFTLGQIKVLSIFVNAAAAGIEAARLYEAERKADARYREVLHMAADGIISIDAEQRILVFNGGAEKFFGYRAEEVLGQPLEMLLPPEVVKAHRHHVQVFGQGPDQSRAMGAGGQRLLGRRKDGTLFNVEVGISRRAENGKMLCTAVVRDITRRVQNEDRIARLTRFYLVLSGVNSAIVRIADETALFSEVCRIAVEDGKFTSAWVGIYDANARDIVLVAGAGRGAHEGRHHIDPATPEGQGLTALAARENRIVWDNDVVARPDLGGAIRQDAIARGARAGAALPLVLDNAVRAVMVLASNTPDAFGEEELSLLRELAGDVSFALDHIAKTRQVDYLATHDQLTGLPNRTLFLDRLAQASATDKREMLAVVLFDVERFKHVNDTFGRQAGDALLRQLADRVRNVVEDRASLARVGGDIFALIYSNFGHAAAVAKVVQRRMDAVMADPFSVDGQVLHLAIRAGGAFFPADGADAETLFKNAEAALKRARAQHERVVFYTPELNARVAEQLALESKLRRALERDEFVLHYQPKVDLATGGIVGLEALIRWQDPETGLVPPMRFISLLEETGLILPVGRWAMREAVRAAAALRVKGPPPLRIAVNVSPIQLRQEDFVRSVEEAIAVAGGVPHGLDLEITESVIMHDIEANVRKLDELRGMGVELAIDDFGTGYSSLAYIARLPVGVIKIDRAFIRNLTDDANSESIVSLIISLTHALKRKVVAEGVETEEQANLLRLLKCDEFQGYLFSRPVPLEQIEILLQQNKSPPK